MQVRSLGQDDPLEEGMVIHSSIFALSLVGCTPQDGKELDMTEACMQMDSNQAWSRF